MSQTISKNIGFAFGMNSINLYKMLIAQLNYAHNQPFVVECRNFNKIRTQFLESESRSICIVMIM